MASKRFIIHVDMDAFFASVEQRDHPELKGKPVAVGSANERGVVAAASYEARTFGVHSALSSRIALQRCPQLIFTPHRFDVYKRVSQQIREIFAQYTALIEPLSLDEAYLDVTASAKTYSEAKRIATQIKDAILVTTQLTASAGIASGKFLAKLASDMEKPNGLTVIHKEQEQEILAQLPIEKFHGIGPATTQKMHSLNIRTGEVLAKADRNLLKRVFGKRGPYFQDIARGIDDRPVQPNRTRKSISKEATFTTNRTSKVALVEDLKPLVERVWSTLLRLEQTATGVVIKVKYEDFTLQTRQIASSNPLNSKSQFEQLAIKVLLEKIEVKRPIRLLGVGVYGLQKPSNIGPKQGKIF